MSYHASALAHFLVNISTSPLIIRNTTLGHNLRRAFPHLLVAGHRSLSYLAGYWRLVCLEYLCGEHRRRVEPMYDSGYEGCRVANAGVVQAHENGALAPLRMA